MGLYSICKPHAQLSSTEDSTKKFHRTSQKKEETTLKLDHTAYFIYISIYIYRYPNMNMSLSSSRMEYVGGFMVMTSNLLWLPCSQLLTVCICPPADGTNTRSQPFPSHTYLFAHANLHYSIAYKCLLQIVILLLFKPLYVSPGTFHKVSGI